jgi:hypothetical protein
MKGEIQLADVSLTHFVSSFLFAVTTFAADADRLKVDLSQLHPTQLLVGEREVTWRKEEMRRLLQKGPDH